MNRMLPEQGVQDAQAGCLLPRYVTVWTTVCVTAKRRRSNSSGGSQSERTKRKSERPSFKTLPLEVYRYSQTMKSPEVS